VQRRRWIISAGRAPVAQSKPRGTRGRWRRSVVRALGGRKATPSDAAKAGVGAGVADGLLDPASDVLGDDDLHLNLSPTHLAFVDGVGQVEQESSEKRSVAGRPGIRSVRAGGRVERRCPSGRSPASANHSSQTGPSGSDRFRIASPSSDADADALAEFHHRPRWASGTDCSSTTTPTSSPTGSPSSTTCRAETCWARRGTSTGCMIPVDDSLLICRIYPAIHL